MSSSPYSILRVKRKADEAPLNALVIEESRRRAAKRSKDGGRDDGPVLGMFRLVQTVQSGWQGQGAEAEALKSRIKEIQSLQAASPAPPEGQDKQPPAMPLPRFPFAGQRLRVIKPIGRAVSGRMTMPSSGTSSPAPTLRFIDAVQDVPMPLQSPPSPPRPGFMPSGAVKPDAEMFMSKEDAEMLRMQEEFLPMLQEAMEEEQTRRATASRSPPTAPDLSKPVPILAPPMFLPPTSQTGEIQWPKYSEQVEVDDDGEYVYDLYFRDADGTSGVVGSAEGLVGALSGYEELLDDELGGSDTEEEDEADEDSNDEDFYRNDYPEDPEDDEYPQGHDAEDEEDDRAYYNRDLRQVDDLDPNRDGFDDTDVDDPEEHPVRRLIRRMQNQSLGGPESEEEE